MISKIADNKEQSIANSLNKIECTKIYNRLSAFLDPNSLLCLSLANRKIQKLLQYTNHYKETLILKYLHCDQEDFYELDEDIIENLIEQKIHFNTIDALEFKWRNQYIEILELDSQWERLFYGMIPDEDYFSLIDKIFDIMKGIAYKFAKNKKNRSEITRIEITEKESF